MYIRGEKCSKVLDAHHISSSSCSFFFFFPPLIFFSLLQSLVPLVIFSSLLTECSLSLLSVMHHLWLERFTLKFLFHWESIQLAQAICRLMAGAPNIKVILMVCILLSRSLSLALPAPVRPEASAGECSEAESRRASAS